MQSDNGNCPTISAPLAGAVEQIDETAAVVYLEVEPSKVVLLQAYFELYEGVGVVRTIDLRASLISIVTTASLLNDCIAVLEAIKEKTGWRYATPSKLEASKLGAGEAKKERAWLTAAKRARAGGGSSREP